MASNKKIKKEQNVSSQMELFGKSSIDTTELDKGVKDLRASRKMQFDNMTKMLTSGKVKDLSIEEKDKFVKLYKMLKQHHSFNDGGLLDEGGMIDEVSGNDVPSGSTREEVRNDIPAQLSEGEFVFPADVVRFIGLEKLMTIRQEAKQGLKQMEAMGQMGNSDEATMRDDMPFDINDLDMEDEVEYNRGGVVEAANGTYVAPTVPTGIQPLGTNPMGNPVGVTQQVADGVSGSTQGTPYVPNVGKTYGAGATPYAPVSYQNFLGPSAGGAPTTENVRYFNEATGQVRMIPHLKNADGSRGATLYPIPEGFVIQEEAPKEEAKKTQVQSAKVAPVDTGGDDGGAGPDSGAVDPAGDPMSYSGFGNKDDLDKTMRSTAAKQLSLLSLNIPSVIGGAITGNTANTKGVLGAITQAFTTTKTNQGNKGIDINNMNGYDRNEINTAVRGAVVAYTAISKDSKGRNIDIMNQLEVVNELATKYGLSKIDITNKPFNIPERIGKKVADIEVEKDKERDREFSKEVYTDVDKVSRGETVDPSSPVSIDPSTIGTGPNQGPLGLYGEERDQGPADDTNTSDTSTDTSVDDVGGDNDEGESPDADDDPGFNQGGLAGKKKISKPKTKKMKRGGLASR